MAQKKHYIFTNKKHSPKSIMSTSLGAIAFTSILLAIYFSYKTGGESNPRYASACVLSLIFAMTGIVLGIMGRIEKDCFYILSYIGIFLNVLVMALASIILYAGALL